MPERFHSLLGHRSPNDSLVASWQIGVDGAEIGDEINGFKVFGNRWINLGLNDGLPWLVIVSLFIRYIRAISVSTEGSVPAARIWESAD